MSFSIVVPSRNINNLRFCVAALREAGETGRVIVVDDGIDWTADKPFYTADSVTVIEGVKPFCFARNCNIGIAAAGTDDVVLLNDDCLLDSKQGLTCMSMQWEEFGILSARITGPAHPVHQRSHSGESNDITRAAFVPFACVFIRRRTLDVVGPLDERFVPGSYEDDDYCRRVIESGHGIGVYNGCTVDHGSLPHTFRPEGKPQLYDLAANKKRFDEKWRK